MALAVFTNAAPSTGSRGGFNEISPPSTDCASDNIHFGWTKHWRLLVRDKFCESVRGCSTPSSQPSQKTPFTATLQSISHHDGALAILKIWKDRLSHIQPTTDVIKHTRRSIIKSALWRNLPLPKLILERTLFGEHGLELEYDSIVVRIANVRQRLSTIIKEDTCPQRTSDELSSIAEELNREARNIDTALQDWTTQIPSTWCYQRHTRSDLRPWPMRNFFSPVVYSYSTPAYAAVWNNRSPTSP